jgi:hypothetical protein
MKWIGITLLVIVLLVVGAISLTIGWRPFIGPKARPLTGRKFEPNPNATGPWPIPGGKPWLL